MTRWERWSDDELLDLRFRELGLRIEGSPLEPRIRRLERELEARGVGFRPHVWLSTEFFSPDGVPGIAVPFYLASPRLLRLERSQLLWAEGAGHRDCMRILRHEAGHAIDTAYGLSRRPEWRAAFGRRSDAYQARYKVDPHSRDHVRHLPRWYAQSHPAEDFAETFAVWLAPRSARDHPTGRAREKLVVVDLLMRAVRDERPATSLRERTESLPRLSGTLADHYRRRRRRQRTEFPAPFDPFLQRAFESGGRRTRRSSAASFLDGRRAGLPARLPGDLRGDAYSAGQVIDSMVLRCRDLGLQLRGTRALPTLDELARVVRNTLRDIRAGRYLVPR